MKSLKTLGAITVGAIVLSASYALAVKDRSFSFSHDSDSGKSVRHIVNGDSGNFMLRDDDRGLTLEASWRGDYKFNADGTDFVSVGKSFEIELEQDGVKQRALFERDGGGVKKTYYVDGDKQPAGAETDAAVSGLLLKFLRASGMAADERVAALLKKGGVAAVMEEFDNLEGDTALRRYAVALAEQANLSNDEINALASKIASIDSDHDLRLALEAVLEHEKVSAETTPALLRAAENVESDHDLRLLVEAFAERSLSDEAMDLALGLYERIDSDHDLRVAAEALLENDALTTQQTTRLLSAAAREIDSDHDLGLLLTETAPMFAKEQALGDAWLDGFATLDSDHEQRLSLTAVADEGGLSQSAWEDLIRAAATIDSDHDKRLALEAIAGEMGDDPALRAAYRDAARTINSEHDRRLALEAIGDEDDD